MSQFTKLLRKINTNLSLPQPEKSRILLELAADMRDLFELHIKKGMSEDEAIKVVEEKYDFSDEALAELIDVHESLFKKLLNKLSEQAQNKWEKIILLVALHVTMILAGKVITTREFFLNSSYFIIPLLGITFISFIVSLTKIYSLFIKKDHTIKKLRKGLPLILFFGGMSLFVGVTGYFVELLRIGNVGMFLETKLFHLIIIDDNFDNVIEWFMKSSSLIMTGLLAAIVSSAFWFILYNKVIKIEQAEAAILLED